MDPIAAIALSPRESGGASGPLVALEPHSQDALNLLDDPRIGELCADIERHLTAHDPEQLRNSARLRESVADEADAILRRMQGAFA